MKKQKKVVFLFVFIIIILLIYFIFFTNKVNVEREFINETTNYITEKLVFNSQRQDIYSLLFLPKLKSSGKNKFPVVIVLPGAQGTKESRSFYADIFSEIKYATLVLDQRGIGETNRQVNSIQQDFNEFAKGRKDKVIQFLMAQDVLNAVDALSKVKEIDNKKIIVLGESMGGRFAIIAAALDKKIKAVIVISTAGYNIPPKNKVESEFFNYINPNAYISRIYPRPLLMLHALDDNVIPIEQAKYTYSLALEPKTFLVVNVSSCIHGYCPEMKNTIQEFLQRV